MKRATAFMREKVAHRGGYVWNYLPDRSRRWGEMEARASMIWIQPPGTPSMGHLFLDAFHATGDDYYYEAAEEVAGALICGPASVRRLELHGGLRRRGVAARAGTTRSARTAGGWKNSSTTGETPRSTMPARPKPRSSCCGCTSRSRIRNTSRRSTRPFASSWTASIRMASGRSGSPVRRSSERTASPTTRRSRRSTTMSPRRTSISC